MEATKGTSKIEIIVQSILGLATVAVLCFFIAVQTGSLDQSDKIAQYAQPLTGNDVVKMLTSNEEQLRTQYQNYDKMLSRARHAGARPFYSATPQDN